MQHSLVLREDSLEGITRSNGYWVHLQSRCGDGSEGKPWLWLRGWQGPPLGRGGHQGLREDAGEGGREHTGLLKELAHPGSV